MVFLFLDDPSARSCSSGRVAVSHITKLSPDSFLRKSFVSPAPWSTNWQTDSSKMLSHSFISSLAVGLLYQVVLVVSQAPLNSITEPPTFVQSAAPDLDGNSASPSCGGCYLVADVAGLVWYSEIFVNSANAVVSVGVGNGTRATRTSVIQNEGAITFNTAGASQSAALTQVAFNPTVSISGAILYVITLLFCGEVGD